MDDQFFKAGGPNFLYLCGEWRCKAPGPTTVPMQYAKTKNAMLWSLEHRFYGDS